MNEKKWMSFREIDCHTNECKHTMVECSYWTASGMFALSFLLVHLLLLYVENTTCIILVCRKLQLHSSCITHTCAKGLQRKLPYELNSFALHAYFMFDNEQIEWMQLVTFTSRDTLVRYTVKPHVAPAYILHSGNFFMSFTWCRCDVFTRNFTVIS